MPTNTPTPLKRAFSLKDLTATTGNDRLLNAIRKLRPPNAEPSIRRKLLEVLTEAFSLEELKTLCWTLHIDGEALYASVDKTVFARELITYCEREQMLGQLIEAAREARPGLKLPVVTASLVTPGS